MGAAGKLVAARYLNGHVVKGYTVDFQPGKACFHVSPGNGPLTRVSLDELKAVFFIKSLEGYPEHDERKQLPEQRGPGERVWIEFSDGEELAGWLVSFSSSREGFYLFPTDENSNIESAFVFRTSLVRILTGEEAQKASREHDAGRPPGARPARWDGVLDRR